MGPYHILDFVCSSIGLRQSSFRRPGKRALFKVFSVPRYSVPRNSSPENASFTLSKSLSLDVRAATFLWATYGAQHVLCIGKEM